MNLRLFSILASLLFLPLAVIAQSGCTDPAASNYDPSATTNDGSCIYPVTHYTPMLRGAFPAILTESSGLIWTDGKLWTHNDSGNPAEMYNVDTTNGNILQTVKIDNYPNVDWESISADSAFIYLGDMGNNSGSRTDLKILKIAKSDISGGSVVHVNAQAISFSYTDQTSYAASSTNNFDCESMISIRDSLYIFTKDRGDHETRVYKLPKTPGTYAVSPFTSFNAGGLVTDASYDPMTNEIVLIGYMPGHTYSFLWFLNDFQDIHFFSGNRRRIEIGSGKEWQSEGVCYLSSSRFFISCETTDSIPASLFIGQKSFGTDLVSTIRKSGLDIFPNPTRGMINVTNLNEPAVYSIVDFAGRVVSSGTLNRGNNNISINMIAPGTYTMVTDETDGERSNYVFVKE